MTGPDVDFGRIRAHGTPAGRAAGFEELASLVVMAGVPGLVEWPERVAFDRFGNPDGGREGRGVLPGGEVWAWQAKYLFALGNDELGQVDASVRRAVETEPNLRRYIVVLPYDRPAGDTRRRGRAVRSAYSKWLEKTAEWRRIAADRGMDVEFVYVGASELVTELTKAENAGRLRYWFGTSVLTPDEQRDRLTDVLNKAGRRYTPKLHVEVSPAATLEALGRSDSYLRRIQLALADVRRIHSALSTRQRLQTAQPAPSAQPTDPNLPDHLAGPAFSAQPAGPDLSAQPAGPDLSAQPVGPDLSDHLAGAEAALDRLLAAVRSTSRLPQVADELTTAEATLRKALHPAGEAARAHPNRSRPADGAAVVGRLVSSGLEALSGALGLVRSVDTAAADRGVLLMTGRAGVGKTHLFCDVASRRLDEGLPTVVLLAQDFDDGALLPQIGKLAGLDGRLDDVLGVLNAAGEAAGRPAMLMIDAINESARADRWADELRVLAGAVDRHPHVVLAVSCRTEFVEPVVGSNDFPYVEHVGFAESTAQAVDRYTAEYGLERITFPVLDPEFGNPLFLKLACEGLSTLGQLTLGNTGLTTVCNAFLEAVNERLARPARCDYDKASHLVQSVVRQLAELGPGPFPRAKVVELADAALPNRTWSRSLYVGLLREGVLLEATGDHVVFSYQRLGDVQRAVLLAEKPAAGLRDWYLTLDDATRWAENGVLGALGLVLPETHGTEILDLFGSVDHQVVVAFLQSLTLRSPEHTTTRTTELVAELLPDPAAWLALLQVACIPGHTANADFLHRVLSTLPLPNRDQTWSNWLSPPDPHPPSNHPEPVDRQGASAHGEVDRHGSSDGGVVVNRQGFSDRGVVVDRRGLPDRGVAVDRRMSSAQGEAVDRRTPLAHGEAVDRRTPSVRGEAVVGVVKVLLEWAWPRVPVARPDGVSRLAALVIGWFLTSADRELRDRATKALVALGEDRPDEFAAAAKAFRGCDDPYVVERLTSALCGVALRSTKAEVVTTVADAAAELVADGVPAHLVTRDNLRRIADAASAHGWSGPDWHPPYGVAWPIETLSDDEANGLAGADPSRGRAASDRRPPNGPLGAVGRVIEPALGGAGRVLEPALGGAGRVLEPALGDDGRVLEPALGDDGRVLGPALGDLTRLLEPALDDFVTGDREALSQQAQRAVLSRAAELGGAAQYGMKYQWIGLYETLGRLADNHQLQDRFEEETGPFAYDGLDQLIGRDIDPTVLVRARPDPGTTWYAPVAATFADEPEVHTDVPDPLDLITLTGPEETRWLSLVRYDNWTQQLPTELAASGAPTLNAWMRTQSYLVALDNVPELRTWAEDQDYEGRWMPEHPEISSRLLATYPIGWDVKAPEPDLPITLHLPNYEYAGTGTTRDTSGSVTGYVPSRLLYEVLDLKHGNDFAWPDSASRAAVLDPTAGLTAVRTFVMRQDLTTALARAGYTLFWTVLTRKELLNDGYDEYRGTSASASYLLVDGIVERI